MAIHKIDPSRPSDPDGPTAVVVLRCRPPHTAAGYWIPTRCDSEVARKGGESNPGVNPDPLRQ